VEFQIPLKYHDIALTSLNDTAGEFNMKRRSFILTAAAASTAGVANSGLVAGDDQFLKYDVTVLKA